MCREWIYLHGICYWQRKYGNVKNSAVELMVIVEFIYGWTDKEYIIIQSQYCELCKNMDCYP